MFSASQLSFFARNGFLHLSNAVPWRACDHLLRLSWKLLPENWSSIDSRTWHGPVTDSCHTGSVLYRRGHMKFQKGRFKSDPVAIDTFGPGSQLAAMVAELLGEQPEVRYRGLYIIAPVAKEAGLADYMPPHVEAHPVNIVALTYLSEVNSGGGGIRVWPGSHRELHPVFGSKFEFMATSEYNSIVKRYAALRPLELSGNAGDVILCHHRLLHAPSLNYSRRMRMAAFCDYILPNCAALARQTPSQDIWEDWAPALRQSDTGESSDHSYLKLEQWEREGIRPVPDHYTVFNKIDSSRLIRTINAREVWVLISTSAALAASVRIEPCGDVSLKDELEVAVGDQRLESVTRNDFVAKLTGAFSTLRISGGRRPIFVRIVRVRAPVSESELLFDGAMMGGEKELTITLGNLESD